MTAALAPAVSHGVGDRAYAEAAGWIGGIAEALSVLMARESSCRERALGFAMVALTRWADPADWMRAGLPPAGAPDRSSSGCGTRLPVSHDAVLRLAHTAMSLRVSCLASAGRPKCWDRLAAFLRSHVPAGNPGLERVAESGLQARVAVGDTSADVLNGLAMAFERHQAEDGEDAYATGVARMNLAMAYLARSAGVDVSRASALAAAETARRAVRYRPTHPVAVEARAHWVSMLLARAEAELDLCARRDLARQAMAEASLTRIAWDRLLGVTSAEAIRSRVQAGHALLLLGELEKARICLECALAFDTRRTDVRDDQTRGRIHFLLSRVYAAAGGA